MTKKLLSVTVRGKDKTWGFSFYGDPRHMVDWEADGLEVHEVINTIPVWAAGLGMTRVWCFAQDLFNFKNPFKD